MVKANVTTKILAVLLAVMVGMSFSFADADAASAATKKPAKKITLRASASGQHAAYLSWNKIKKPQKGYAVFRDGKCIARLSKKRTSYSDSGLAAGSGHTYQIKIWKKKGKGKKAKFKYSKASNKVGIRTASAPAPTAGGGSDGGTSGSTPGGSGTTTPSSKTVTDYLGVTRTITDTSTSGDKTYYTATDSQGLAGVYDNLAKIDRTTNGEFTVSGCGQMKQISGATFIMGCIEDATNSVDGNLYIPAYNLDTSKLSIQYGNGVSIGMQRNTYVNPSGTTLNSYKPYYFVKNGKRIAETTTNGNPVRYEAGAYATGIKRKDLVTTIKIAIYKDGDGMGHALGFYNADIPVIVKYDGKDVGTITVSSCKTATVNGILSNMHPKRALALDVACEGIRTATGSENGTGNLKQDLNLLASWFGENYDHASYPGTNTTITKYGVTEKVGCELCTYILETWAIYQYGDQGLGFAGWGLGGDDHYAFHLDSDKNVFYDTTYRNQ